MIAHIRESDGAAQPLSAHCEAVGRLCSASAQAIGLPHLARLMGLLHDMGKATKQFEAYLRAALSENAAASPHHHAPTGAIYAYRRWFLRPGATPRVRATAQIIMLCISGHHAGLADCLDQRGMSPLLQGLEAETRPVHADEAIAWFHQHVADESALDALFQAGCAEIAALFPDLSLTNASTEAALGLLCRLLLSMLVDADRWDSACFEYGEDPFAASAPAPDWRALLDVFDQFRQANLTNAGKINRIRADISDRCFEKAALPPGIVTLSVPTGGGKTYSSLRYALRHAALHGQTRIFYIIPYNTILDQNAQDIRDALGGYPSILEHHSNVVLETEDEQTAYKRLTERWNCDIILTSLVQFLNACYAAPNSAARRFHRLTNAVLIFDEIQSLPKHCKVLFERAIQFLSTYGRSTVVLCTATQPRLTLSPAPSELIPQAEALYAQLKRVHYIPQPDFGRTYASAGQRIAQLMEEKSVLVIVNIKAAAWSVFQAATEALQARGHALIFSDNAPDAAPDAEQAGPKEEILCIHMSTLLCPAHRKVLIARMKAWLKAGKRVLCVSTALIEAGINVSFPVVIRDLAGLPSIVQAAGRANRNMEYGSGEVLIWNFPEETNALSKLPDVQKGANITAGIFANPSIAPDELDSPAMIDQYFRSEEPYIQETQRFPADVSAPGEKKIMAYLTDLLAKNGKYTHEARCNVQSSQALVLHQSFRTAAKHFFVISDETTPVLVPWGEGVEIIAALNGRHDMQEEIRLLRKAQAYTVNLYESTFRHLREAGAIWQPAQSNVCILKEGYYSKEAGVSVEMGSLEFVFF